MTISVRQSLIYKEIKLQLLNSCAQYFYNGIIILKISNISDIVNNSFSGRRCETLTSIYLIL